MELKKNIQNHWVTCKKENLQNKYRVYFTNERIVFKIIIILKYNNYILFKNKKIFKI